MSRGDYVEPSLSIEHLFVYGAIVDHADLVSLQRSAAMIQPGASIPVRREHLLAMCDELISTRALLQRLGADLKTVAKRAP